MGPFGREILQFVDRIIDHVNARGAGVDVVDIFFAEHAKHGGLQRHDDLVVGIVAAIGALRRQDADDFKRGVVDFDGLPIGFSVPKRLVHTVVPMTATRARSRHSS